jgi:DNA polymerase-1
MDASAFIHRSFHALGNMATRAGVPTGAAFGFTNALLRLLRESRPTYLGVIFDSKGKTRRHGLYPEYKATRKPMDPRLASQMEPIREIVRALGLVALEKEGYEADDIIASLCRLAVSESKPVVIVSGDKDFYQLLSPTVSMYDPDPKKNSAMTLESFKARFKIEPEAFLDVQALKGDSSDNIPGVPKVGDVTALKLISDWGSLDNLYKNLSRVTNDKIRLSLTENEATARLSRALAKLGEGLEPMVPIEGLRPGKPDAQALFPVLSSLEFSKFANDLRKSGPVWLGEDMAKGFVAEAASAPAPKRVVTRLFGPGSADHGEPGDDGAPGARAVLVDGSGPWAELTEALAAARAAGGPVGLAHELSGADMDLASGREGGALVGLALAPREGLGFYVPINHQGHANQPPDLVREKLGGFLAGPRPVRVAHNAKALSHALSGLLGARDAGGPAPEDPMLAAYLLNPDDRNDLPSLGAKYLGLPLDRLAGTETKRPNPALDPPEASLSRAAARAVATLDLGRELNGRLGKDPALERLYFQLELPLSGLLARIEEIGVPVDPVALGALSAEMEKSLGGMAERIYSQADRRFNIGSPKQLAEVLFEDMKLPTAKKTAKKTGYSTDNEVLTELALLYPIASDILGYREISKLKNTYADKLPLAINQATGRIHTTYNQALTVTGRLSSSEPNLQNIPAKSEEGRRIRSAFTAAPGSLLLSADYSQIELRIMAHFSGDKSLIEAFRDNDDIHAQTAAEIFGLPPGEVPPDARRQAKTINFGIIYGQGPFGLSKQLNIPFQDAKRFIDRYFERFPGVLAYMERTRKEAARNGFVTTWYGRRRYLPGLADVGAAKREAERMAINTPIQGTAADIIKMAMIQVDRAIQAKKMASRIIMQVHDELVLEVPEAELPDATALVTSEMEAVGQKPLMDGARPLTVNLRVDAAHGRSWVHA